MSIHKRKLTVKPTKVNVTRSIAPLQMKIHYRAAKDSQQTEASRHRHEATTRPFVFCEKCYSQLLLNNPSFLNIHFNCNAMCSVWAKLMQKNDKKLTEKQQKQNNFDDITDIRLILHANYHFFRCQVGRGVQGEGI